MRKTRNITGTIAVRAIFGVLPSAALTATANYRTSRHSDLIPYDMIGPTLRSLSHIDEFMQVRGSVVCPASICRSNWTVFADKFLL